MIDPREVERLLSDLESDRVERTEGVKDSDKFCKAICAFANDMPGHALPGYLCTGVERHGTPTAVPIDERLLESLASHRSNGQIMPMPTMEVAKVDYRGVPIVVVMVQPSDLPPVRYRMQTWRFRTPAHSSVTSAGDNFRMVSPTEIPYSRKPPRTWAL